MASSAFKSWLPRPFPFKTTGTLVESVSCFGEAEVSVEASSSQDFRGWALLLVKGVDAVNFDRTPPDREAVAVRVSPNAVRRLRDELDKVIEQSEAASWAGR